MFFRAIISFFALGLFSTFSPSEDDDNIIDALTTINCHLLHQ